MTANRHNPLPGIIVFILALGIGTPGTLMAEPRSTTDSPIINRLGGQVSVEGSVTGYDQNSYFEPVGTAPGLDTLTRIRLTDRISFSSKAYADIHYEVSTAWGETFEKIQTLKKASKVLSKALVTDGSDTDKRRLFDLTTTIDETDESAVTHRLDRLLFSFKPAWGDITVGRQAVTWGNGFMFNPMDLFNPFAPSDTVRDYKTGDDLVSTRILGQDGSEWHLLYVPRRDSTTGRMSFEHSSVAAKLHFFTADVEMDLMAAMHYNEIVVGVGTTGNIGGAAWRWDLVWSTLEQGRNPEGYVSAVANIDYTWVWFQKNMYGLIEYYHNGLGRTDYTDAMADPDLAERTDRGELFVLGKNYAGLRIQMELHPLFNVYLGVINNPGDPSGMVQPWAVWSVTQNSTINMGATVYYGAGDSEFGGFLIPGTSCRTNAATVGHLLFTWYF